MSDEMLIEVLAAQAHQSWSGWNEWMRYKAVQNEDGSITIPQSWVERWVRQTNTPYELLSEQEKESDRVEARKYLDIINGNRG